MLTPLARKVLTVRACLFMLVGAVLIPSVVIGAVVIWRLAQAETRELESRAHEVVVELNFSIERALSNLVADASVLANSDSLRTGDVATFHARMRHAQQVLGASAVGLLDARSRHVANSNVPFGQPLPLTSSVIADNERAVRSGVPMFTDVFTGLTSGIRQFAVILPLPGGSDETSPRFLAVSMPISRIQAIVDHEVSLRDGMVAAVLDRKGGEIARAPAANRDPMLLGITGAGIIGAESIAPGHAAPAQSAPGIGGQATVAGPTLRTGRNAAGQEMVVFASRSGRSDWDIVAGIPSTLLYAPLRSAIVSVGLMTTAGLGLAVALSLLLAARLNGAIGALADLAGC